MEDTKEENGTELMANHCRLQRRQVGTDTKKVLIRQTQT